MDWDPDFLDRSPMLEPLREHASRLGSHAGWPGRADLQRLLDERLITTAGGARLRLVDPSGAHAPYEQRIYQHGEMDYRSRGWHDLFNVLAWLAFPRTKAALNAGHFDAPRSSPAAGAEARAAPRSRARDALTLFDESGAVVASQDAELLDDLRTFRWKRLFCERRERVRASMRFYVLGHSLFEKALRPYTGMTAHALLLRVDAAFMAAPPVRQHEAIDALAAERIAALTGPRVLSPLPLLGVPGWWPENEEEAFYADERYFRPRRSRQ